MADLDYLMFDSDNHLYEGTDAFTRHLDPQFADEFKWVTDERGRRHIVLHGKFWPYIGIPTFDPVATPGSMELLYKGQLTKQELKAQGIKLMEPLADRPEYQNRAERLGCGVDDPLVRRGLGDMWSKLHGHQRSIVPSRRIFRWS